jgi:hypothetical protein
VRWTFYTTYVQTEVDRIDYTGHNCEAANLPFCSSCVHGGRAFLAFQIIVFPLLLALLTVEVFRVTGGIAIKALSHPAKSILFETVAASVSAVFYFLAVVSFGATCIKSAKDFPAASSSTLTGTAFSIFCLVLLLMQACVLAMIGADRSCHLGWQATHTLHPDSHTAAFIDGQTEQDAQWAREEYESRQKVYASRSSSFAGSPAAAGGYQTSDSSIEPANPASEQKFAQHERA